jgi:excinuclease UvrABC nuclease subunit
MSGLLYIGKAENLKSRIAKFFRCVGAENHQDIKHFHSAAVTFLSFNFSQKINPKDLQYRYCKLPKEEIRSSETRLLQQYAESYLDKPPLNTVVKRQK